MTQQIVPTALDNDQLDSALAAALNNGDEELSEVLFAERSRRIKLESSKWDTPVEEFDMVKVVLTSRQADEIDLFLLEQVQALVESEWEKELIDSVLVKQTRVTAPVRVWRQVEPLIDPEAFVENALAQSNAETDEQVALVKASALKMATSMEQRISSALAKVF